MEPILLLAEPSITRAMVGCSFCYTGTTGEADASVSWGDGYLRMIQDLLRLGPDSPADYKICKPCFESKQHLRRTQCQHCGKLSSFLAVDHNSMTNKWASVGTNHVGLCESCAVYLYDRATGNWDFSSLPYPKYVIMTDEEVALVCRLWREYPDWKTRTKMPPLHRRLDENWEGSW